MELNATNIFTSLWVLDRKSRGDGEKLQKAIRKFAKTSELLDARIGKPMSGEGADVNSPQLKIAERQLESQLREILGERFAARFGPPQSSPDEPSKANHLVHFGRDHELERMRAGHKLLHAFETYDTTLTAIEQMHEIVGRAVVDSIGRPGFVVFAGVRLPEKITSAHFQEIGDWATTYVYQSVESKARRHGEIPEAFREVFGWADDLFADDPHGSAIMSDLGGIYSRVCQYETGPLKLPSLAANSERHAHVFQDVGRVLDSFKR